MPVHSTKRVAPPFALLDDEGRVQAYVTPMPGLNLRRYTKKYVGIVGENTLRQLAARYPRVGSTRRETGQVIALTPFPPLANPLADRHVSVGDLHLQRGAERMDLEL